MKAGRAPGGRRCLGAARSTPFPAAGCRRGESERRRVPAQRGCVGWRGSESTRMAVLVRGLWARPWRLQIARRRALPARRAVTLQFTGERGHRHRRAARPVGPRRWAQTAGRLRPDSARARGSQPRGSRACARPARRAVCTANQPPPALFRAAFGDTADPPAPRPPRRGCPTHTRTRAKPAPR